jgi:hypothetical protein
MRGGMKESDNAILLHPRIELLADQIKGRRLLRHSEMSYRRDGICRLEDHSNAVREHAPS